MAITFPITGVTNAVSNLRSPAFTLGTAPAENDIIVAYISSTTPAATTDVSGWTNVLGANQVISLSDDSMAAAMAYHRVTAAEAAANTVTWTLTNFWNASETGRITTAVLRGVATSDELVGTASGFNINIVQPVIPDVTPTADDCQIMAGVAMDTNGITLTTPAGHTLRSGATGTQTNSLYSLDTLGTSGVATGTTNVTASTSDEYISIVACFAPAPQDPVTFGVRVNQAVQRAAVY
jgi:hypothetical protein